MKMKTKRILSLLMTFILVVGLLPVSALGAEVEPYDQIHRFKETKDPAYFDGEGKAWASPEVTSADADKMVTISETIKKTDEVNKFDITMKVTTKEIVETEIVSADAAVVLVIDVSSSMVEFCADCGVPIIRHSLDGASIPRVCTTGPNIGAPTDAIGGIACSSCGLYEAAHEMGKVAIPSHLDKMQTRLDVAKQAATAFVRDLAAGANGAQRMVSVVQFSNQTDARVVQEWIDVGAENNVAQVIEKIDGLAPRNATAVDAGMQLAEIQLNSSDVKNKSVVLFCDGMPNPNQSISQADSELYSVTPAEREALEADIKAAYPATGQQAPIVLGRRMKAAGATVYSVGYATGTTGRNWMNSFSSKSFLADNAADLSDAFKEIFKDIEKSTSSGASGMAIPLGDYITLIEGENEKISFSDTKATISYADGAINWNLKATDAEKVVQDNTTTYTYEMTFRATLDTWAEGFMADDYYPINKTTILRYVVAKNDVASAAENLLTFRVPQVRGQMPMVDYKVNYYLNDRAGENPVLQTESYTRTDAFRSLVTADTKTYKNYTQQSGDTAITLGEDAAKNVINIYFNPTPAKVIVNHYVTTTTISEENPEGVTAAAVLRKTDTTEKVFLGDTFNAEQLTDTDTFKFDERNENNTKPYKGIMLTKTDTIISLYYTETVDTRRDATVVVNYIGRDEEWVRGTDGKYTETVSADKTLHEVNGGGKHNTTFTASTETVGIAALAGYTLDTEKTKETSLVLNAAKPGVINLYYVKQVNAEPEKATLTVTHHYTTEVQNADGSKTSSTEKDIKASVPVYVDETHTIAPQTTYGEYANWKFTGDEKGTAVTIVKGENTLDLYYTRNLIKQPTTVTVNHSYQDYEWKLVDITETVIETVIETVVTQVPGETTDEETGEVTTVMTDVTTEVGKEVEKTVVVGQELQPVPKGAPVNEAETIEGLFAGDTYTAQQKSKIGYALIGEDRKTIEHLAEKDNVITFNYERIPAKPDEDSDVTVIHVYRTYMKYVDEDGVVHSTYVQVGQDEKVAEEKQIGVKGEWFMADPVTDHGDNADYRVLDDKNQPIENAPVQKVTFDGVGAEHVITYARYVDDRTTTTLTVIPVYVSYQRVINAEGKDVVVELARVEGTSWSPEGTLYQGQSYSVTPGQFAKTGFDFSSILTTDAYENLKLNNTTVYLYYTQIIPTDNRGTPVDVVVNHNYSYTTKTIVDGVYKEDIAKTTNTDTTVKLYPGQTFKTAGLEKVLPGYTWADPKPTAEYTQNGTDITIDFYYTGETDHTKKATLTVTHKYSILDQDGIEQLAAEEQEKVVTPTGDSLYATANYTVSPEYKSGAFTVEHITTKTHNDAPVDSFAIVLAEKSDVVITYVKRVNLEKPTTVTVLHNYAELDLNGNVRTPKGTYTETFNTTGQGAIIGKDFHAMLRPTNTANRSVAEDLLHTFEHANVAHGTQEPVDVNLHEEDTAKLAAVVLSKDGATITINYLRTVDTTPVPPDPGPGPGPDYSSYRVTVQYKKLGTNETLAENYRTDGIREGRTYDVSAQAALAITGYAIDHVEGETAGTLRHNVVVTVWYTAKSDVVDPVVPPTNPEQPGELPEEEIVDEDVPLTDLPTVGQPDGERTLPPENGDIIIVDDGVPMGNLPQTGTTRNGGNAAAGAVLGLGGLISALGAGMLLKGKRKEEN